jgi:hypothetical protein
MKIKVKKVEKKKIEDVLNGSVVIIGGRACIKLAWREPDGRFITACLDNGSGFYVTPGETVEIPGKAYYCQLEN